MSYGVIYKATNLINGKCYIGQTKDFDKRKNDHYKQFNNHNCHFYHALKKHGWNNFKWELIEECDSKKELNEMEFHYIKQFNSNSWLWGYNMTIGGEGGDTWNFSTPESRNIRRKKHSERQSNGKHWIYSLTEDEYNEWIENNFKGENHPHRKHCQSEEKYQKWLDDHQRGENNPTRKYKTQEEYEEWLNKNFRGKNNPMFGMTGEKHPNFGMTFSHSAETKLKMSRSRKGKTGRKTGKNIPFKIQLLTGDEFVVIDGVRAFVRWFKENTNYSFKRKSIHKFKDTGYKGIKFEIIDKKNINNYVSWEDDLSNKERIDCINKHFKILNGCNEPK